MLYLRFDLPVVGSQAWLPLRPEGAAQVEQMMTNTEPTSNDIRLVFSPYNQQRVT